MIPLFRCEAHLMLSRVVEEAESEEGGKQQKLIN